MVSVMLCKTGSFVSDTFCSTQLEQHLSSVCNDVPGAYEGLASAAVILLKHDASDLPVPRNLSFSLHHGFSAATGSILNSIALRSEFPLP